MQSVNLEKIAVPFNEFYNRPIPYEIVMIWGSAYEYTGSRSIDNMLWVVLERTEKALEYEASHPLNNKATTPNLIKEVMGQSTH
jgi:hypothetical protein